MADAHTEGGSAQAPTTSDQPILEGILSQLTGLNSKIELVNSQYGEIREFMYGDEDLMKTVSHFGFRVNEVPCLLNDTKTMKENIELLKGIVIKQNEEINELRKISTDLTTRSMRNIILVYVLEKEGENCEAEFLNIVKTRLNIDLDPMQVERAHRKGPKNIGKGRPLIVKLTSSKDVSLDRILGAAKTCRKPKTVNQNRMFS